MADKKEDKSKDENKKKGEDAGREIISGKATIYLIIALLILAGAMIYGPKKEVQTKITWQYQEEKYWDRGKFSSFAAIDVVIKPNSIFFSFYGTKEKFWMQCIRNNPRSNRFICSYSNQNGRLISGPEPVYLDKINDFLYEGEDKLILYKGKKYLNIKIRLEGGTYTK